MGKETTAPHDCTKTQYQWTIDWTKNILIFSTSKLTKTISPTVWLKLNVDLKKGIGNPMAMYFNTITEGLFSTYYQKNYTTSHLIISFVQKVELEEINMNP